MNAMIVVHTLTGKTAILARAMAEVLRERGHEVNVELLRAAGPPALVGKTARLRRVPQTDTCDMLLVGGPVRAFDAAPAVAAFLRQPGELNGKKAMPFVTHFLPFRWMGPNRALRSMTVALEAAGAQVVPGGTLWCGVFPHRGRSRRAAVAMCDRLLGG
jgi:hypothetical protein